MEDINEILYCDDVTIQITEDIWLLILIKYWTLIIWKNDYWLVVSTPLTNISQLGWFFFSIYEKNKASSKPPASIV